MARGKEVTGLMVLGRLVTPGCVVLVQSSVCTCCVGVISSSYRNLAKKEREEREQQLEFVAD